MSQKIALVVHNSTNAWFEIKTMDEQGNQRSLHSGDDLGRVLNYAASVLGHTLVIPLSGPETSF